MTQFRRACMRVLAFLAIGVAVGFLAPHVLPVRGWVRRSIADALEANGWVVNRLEVRSVSWRRVDLADVELSRGAAVRVGSLRTDFVATGLLRGRVARATASGLEIEIDAENPWDELRTLLNLGSGESPGTMPFDTFSVEAGSVCVRRGEFVAHVPFSAETSDDVSRGKSYAVRIELPGGLARAKGRLGGGSRDPLLEVEAKVRDIKAVLDAMGLDYGDRLPSGRLELDLRVAPRGDGGTFRAECRFACDGDLPVGAVRIPVDSCNGALHAEFAAGLRCVDFGGTLAAASIGSGPTKILSPSLVLRRIGQGLACDVAAHGDTWRFATAQISFPDLFQLPDPGSAVDGPGPAIFPGRIEGDLMVREARAEVGGAGLFLEEARAVCVWRRGKSSPYAVTQASVRIGQGRIDVAPAALAVRDVSADWDLVSPGRATGRFRAGNVDWGECRAPGGEIRFEHEHGELGGHVTWPFLSEEPLRFTVGRDGGRPDAAWRVDLPPAQVRFAADGLGACFRDRFGWESRGTVGLSGTVRSTFAGRPDVALRIVTPGFELRRDGVRFEGVSGELSVRGGREFKIESAGPWLADRIVLGGFTLREGRARFRLDGSGRAVVEQASCSWEGGRIRAAPCRFDAASAEPVRVTLFAEGLPLDAVLRTVTGGRATGTGTLYGKLPLALRRRPVLGVAFGEGYLYAAPGRGVLRAGDPALVAQWLDSADVDVREAGLSGTVRRSVADSLREFEYTALGIDLVPTASGRPAGRMSIEGEGVGPGGVPLRLAVRFSVDALGP